MNDVVNYLMAPFPTRFSERTWLGEASRASKSNNFFEKHFAPAGYGALAWIQSLIDIPTHVPEFITWVPYSIVTWGKGDSFKMLLALSQSTLQCALHLLLLPLYILTGIFVPDATWGVLDLDFHPELRISP